MAHRVGTLVTILHAMPVSKANEIIQPTTVSFFGAVGGNIVREGVFISHLPNVDVMPAAQLR